MLEYTSSARGKVLWIQPNEMLVAGETGKAESKSSRSRPAKHSAEPAHLAVREASEGQRRIAAANRSSESQQRIAAGSDQRGR